MGFTMLELIIAMAVLAIIIAIAVPSYRSQGLRANRTEAMDELLRQVAFQQRQFTANNQFVDTPNFLTDSGSYQIRINVGDDNQTYTMSAVPQDSQTDDSCGTMRITSLGRKIATGGNNQRCWAGQNG